MCVEAPWNLESCLKVAPDPLGLGQDKGDDCKRKNYNGAAQVSNEVRMMRPLLVGFQVSLAPNKPWQPVDTEAESQLERGCASMCNDGLVESPGVRIRCQPRQVGL